MSDGSPMPPEPDPIERAVRDHLDRQAGGVDAAAMLARVKAAAVPASPRRRWLRWAIGAAAGVAVAAALVVGFLTGGGPEPRPVAAETPAELIEKAREAHAGPTDRCYEVVAEWNPEPLRRLKLEPVVRRSRLWTRGDQFWIETTAPDGRTVAWGQTRDGRVWAAPSPKRGLVFEPSEVGEPLARHCELMSLRVVTTLGELLREYDLFRRDGGRPGEPIRIEAVLRPAPADPLPRFRQVELELDPDTKAIRSATLKRLLNGEPVGTLTFTLVETAELPDDRYDVRGHLDRDAVVLDGRQAKLPNGRPDPRAKFRDEFLKRMQGRLK